MEATDCWREGLVGGPPPFLCQGKQKAVPTRPEAGYSGSGLELVSEISSGLAGAVRISRAAGASSSRTRILKPAPDQARCSRIPPAVSAWIIAGIPADSSALLARSASGRSAVGLNDDEVWVLHVCSICLRGGNGVAWLE